MPANDGLDGMLPQVASWFRTTYGLPTPPQREGWPAIASGRNTLIFAPTGSGKTLAAFLACLDHLWRIPTRSSGVRILYISPLKALNQDVYRNLQLPLEGILATAEAQGKPLHPLSIAVRSGDTPAADRRRLGRNPPQILITTPESLHLLLTSRARETLRTLSHVIVDEIHALCPNKRGVFLALLLERLQAINSREFLRIGLSATQRPLDEVARYLGGLRKVRDSDVTTRFEPRPVTIIDTGQRKELDLEVISPFERAGTQPAGSVWPAIERRLLGLIEAHDTTIVFANTRAVVERLTARLNEHAEAQAEAPLTPLVRSHHGSLSQEERRLTESTLKEGELKAVVATASLELGIDMGAVDLVCQVESPGAVSRGLQRVGRAGHLVGRTSKGKLIAKTASDLLESAALCRAMLAGDVETLKVPAGCLDVLAQQVVACVAMDRWEVPALFDLVRGAYPYRNLTASALESVLMMVSGRFPVGTLRDLRARLSWDRVHNVLNALPGTARLALTGGGTIPDTGHYPVYLGEDGPRLGELDEEFVLERRVGEAFVLGTAVWRIDAIEPQSVRVSRDEGQSAMIPFWRGEQSSRSPELGLAVGALSREIAGRLDDPGLIDWLRSECRLNAAAAICLRDYIERQIRLAGTAPDDRTVLVETFVDPAGELGLAVLTPFGGKLHQGLKLVLQAKLRQRLGISVATLHGDAGILIRLPGTDEPPLDLFTGLTPEDADRLIREELGDSALFGLRFRQNAGRALLMPRPDPAKRTPLWLQRLRARDLLQVVRKFPEFPIVVETYRECLDDDLDLPRLRDFLSQVAAGSIRVVVRRGEIASPFTSDLIFRFTLQYLYQWDEPKGGDRPSGPSAVSADLLDPLLEGAAPSHWLEPGAIGRVEGRLRGTGRPPRSAEEMAESLRRFGDITQSEVAGPMLAFLTELEAAGRAVTIELPGTTESARWIGAEDAPLYAAAFGAARDEPALETVVRRYLETHALIGLDDLTARYPIGPARATDLLERFEEAGRVIMLGPAQGTDATRWADPKNLEEVRRLSIAMRRRESVAVLPEVFADFVARRQHVHPATRRVAPAEVGLVLEQLQGYAATAELWESELLPRRVNGYRPDWLNELLAGGEWLWRAHADSNSEPRVAFLRRDSSGNWPSSEEVPELGPPENLILEHLLHRGASFASELARELGVELWRVQRGVDRLALRGLATNDRFDPLRAPARAAVGALALTATSPTPRRQGLPRQPFRRTNGPVPEGRWSRVDAGDGDPETASLWWAGVLLARYGVLTKETVAADPWAPPWRELVPWLARAELRGELRRGYFVEGLSGVQYASAEAAQELAELAGARPSSNETYLVSTLDPANLYGAGAPLDIDLLEGGTARLPRSPANFLVVSGGRPVLIIEAFGKRLTGLASASEPELTAGLAWLPSLTGPSRRVMKVETYNGVPAATSPVATLLGELGFVRDYPGMAFYAGW